MSIADLPDFLTVEETAALYDAAGLDSRTSEPVPFPVIEAGRRTPGSKNPGMHSASRGLRKNLVVRSEGLEPPTF